MIKGKNTTIYFAGDTGYGKHFSEIKKLVGNIDICILPIGAYKPRFIMENIHMDPQEALKAFHDLEGKELIPMHYATYDLSDEPISEPIRLMRQFKEEGMLKGKLVELMVGEEYEYEKEKKITEISKKEINLI